MIRLFKLAALAIPLVVLTITAQAQPYGRRGYHRPPPHRFYPHHVYHHPRRDDRR